MPTLNLSPTDIFSSLDLDAIDAAMRGDNQILSFDFEDAKRMLLAAVDKWLLPDLTYLAADSLRLESEFKMSCGGYPVHGFLDVTGVYKTGPYKGQKLVADWKTSDSDLDTTWQDRLVSSWQLKTYAAAEKADIVNFRGINRKGRCRDVFVPIPEGYFIPAVNNYYCMVGDQMRAVSKYPTWPRNMPSACGAYGQTCPFKNDCLMENMPPYEISIEEISLSYSGAGRFLSCPEKYRRLKQAVKGIDGSEATMLGSSLHRGAEEVWRQSFAKYGE